MLTKEERQEFELRRQRVTDHLLECLTSSKIPDDLMHYFRLGEWLHVHDYVDRIAACAPRGLKDRDGVRECLISGALQCLHLAADLERVRTIDRVPAKKKAPAKRAPVKRKKLRG